MARLIEHNTPIKGSVTPATPDEVGDRTGWPISGVPIDDVVRWYWRVKEWQLAITGIVRHFGGTDEPFPDMVGTFANHRDSDGNSPANEKEILRYPVTIMTLDMDGADFAISASLGINIDSPAARFEGGGMEELAISLTFLMIATDVSLGTGELVAETFLDFDPSLATVPGTLNIDGYSCNLVTFADGWSVNVAISVLSYWEYDDGNGPTWDATTGALLKPANLLVETFLNS